MERLPEELIFYIASYLNGWECIILSHTCSRFMSLFNNDHFWRTTFLREKLVHDASVDAEAARIAQPQKSTVDKWSYILHSRLRRNWRSASFKATSMPLRHGSVIGHDDRQLTVWSPCDDSLTFDVWVYQINGRGCREVLQRRTRMSDHLSPSQRLASVLVARGVAVLCFTDDNDASQEIIAVDLVDLCERWRDDGHLTRLFGNYIYAFKLTTYTVRIFDIRSQVRVHQLSLPLDIRLPYGHVSGDGHHLAVPGKMVLDNSPVVSVTNVRTGKHNYLAPTTPVCPCRWFERTEVLSGKVYGMLNRRTLFIWDAESGGCLGRLEISDSPPGMADSNLSFNFLTASASTICGGLIATAHAISSGLNLFSAESNAGTRLPQIDMEEIMGVPVKVCDAHFTADCLVVRTLNCQIPQFHVSIFPLPIQDEVVETYAESRLINLIPVNDTSLYPLSVTPSKIINVSERLLRIYDLL